MFCESHVISVVQFSLHIRRLVLSGTLQNCLVPAVSRFDFVIRSVNNLKKTRLKIVNRSETSYG